MPIETEIEHNGQVTFPTSASAFWLDAGMATILDDADAAVNKPQGFANLATRLFRRPNQQYGTNLVARMSYEDGAGITTSPIVILYGRKNSDDPWQPLANKADATLAALTAILVATATHAIDHDDGTLRYTTVRNDLNVWDTCGCNEFAFAVSTPVAGSGTVTTASIQVKFL